MAADLHGDGEVDFEEFMKHFPTVLNMIQFNKYMNSKFAEAIGKDQENNKLENLDGEGSQMEEGL